MLPAQKKSSCNYLTEYDNVQARSKKVREVVVTRRNALRKFKAVCAIVFAFLLCLFILFRYSQINEYNQRLAKLKTEVNQLQKANSQLKVEMDRKIDLKEIEKAAIERLGMQYMDKNQVVYLQLQKSDFTEVHGNADADRLRDTGVFGTLTQGISELVRYLY